MTHWTVYVSQAVIGWSRTVRDEPTFNDVIEAVERVRRVADLYDEFGIAVCQLGFKIPIPNTDAFFRCYTRQTHKQIHITDVVFPQK